MIEKLINSVCECAKKVTLFFTLAKKNVFLSYFPRIGKTFHRVPQK